MISEVKQILMMLTSISLEAPVQKIPSITPAVHISISSFTDMAINFIKEQ